MKRAVKQSVVSKILSICSIALVLIVVLVTVADGLANTKLAAALDNKNILVFNANRFKNGSSYLTSEVRAYAANGNKVHFDNYWNEVNSLKNRDIAKENMFALGLTQEEQRMIETIGNTSNNLIPLEEKAMEASRVGERDTAIGYVYGEEYLSSVAIITQGTQSFMDSIEKRTDADVAKASAWVELFGVVCYVLLALLIVLQVVIVLFVNRRLLRPMIRVKDNMQLMAQGDLSAEVGLEPDTSEVGMLVQAIYSTKIFLKSMVGDIRLSLNSMAQGKFDFTITKEYIGEFDEIKTSLQTILTSLNDTLFKIDGVSHEVSTGSKQVSSSAQLLSQGATEQASAVQQLAATINEISAQVRKTAENAKSTDILSSEAGQKLKRGNDEMEQLLSAMSEIEQSSKQIGKIIKTVNDIAFQTNILALNAAVEAARAGAAGKGFAVVADEVRSLSGKSAAAAKETTALIERSVRAVANGTQIAASTAKTLQEVIDGEQRSSQMVRYITQASAEQAHSISQVTLGVEQISGVVQTNSATAEESAAASEQLSGQAQLLRGLVAQFQLRGESALNDSRAWAEK